MKHEFEIHSVDYVDIEKRARQMRAEAFGAQARALGTWLRGAFHTPAFPQRRGA